MSLGFSEDCDEAGGLSLDFNFCQADFPSYDSSVCCFEPSFSSWLCVYGLELFDFMRAHNSPNRSHKRNFRIYLNTPLLQLIPRLTQNNYNDSTLSFVQSVICFTFLSAAYKKGGHVPQTRRRMLRLYKEKTRGSIYTQKKTCIQNPYSPFIS